MKIKTLQTLIGIPAPISFNVVLGFPDFLISGRRELIMLILEANIDGNNPPMAVADIPIMAPRMKCQGLNTKLSAAGMSAEENWEERNENA